MYCDEHDFTLHACDSQNQTHGIKEQQTNKNRLTTLHNKSKTFLSLTNKKKHN